MTSLEWIGASQGSDLPASRYRKKKVRARRARGVRRAKQMQAMSAVTKPQTISSVDAKKSGRFIRVNIGRPLALNMCCVPQAQPKRLCQRI